MIKTITKSRTYQLSIKTNQWNEDDRINYSHALPRRLPAEVLLDAYSQALDSPTVFPGGPGKFPPGTRAIELPDENVPDSFLDVFGRPARTSACECERVAAPSLAQALTLINSAEVQRKLTDPRGYITSYTHNDRGLLERTTLPDPDGARQSRVDAVSIGRCLRAPPACSCSPR